MLEIESKAKRLRVLRAIPGWLWRLGFSALFGGMVFATAVPWAAAQRGNTAIGGEYLLVLTAVVVPFCVFRR